MVAMLAAHAVLPLELSRRGPRLRPGGLAGGAMRAAGIVMVAGGSALVGWALAHHYRAAPDGWSLEPSWTPGYLLRKGPYRLTRNPMYVGDCAMWLGWTLFTGSAAVATGFVLLCAAFAGLVRWEERRLIERFGSAYLVYRSQVPRWVGGK
jgi:protein-S-isoprenylcysteine O-methyltransferase Ste14